MAFAALRGASPELGSSPPPLGDCLLELGIASRRQLRAARATARGDGARAERVLLDAGAVSGAELIEAIRQRWSGEPVERLARRTESGLDPLLAPPTPWPAIAGAGGDASSGTLSLPLPLSLPDLSDALSGEWLARLLRVLSTAAATAAAVVAVDLVLMIAWQEPLSALVTQREQAALNSALDALGHREQVRAEVRVAPAPPSFAELAAREERRLSTGEPVGRIELPTLGREYAVVQGVDTASLTKGPGHFPDSSLPGQGGTFAVAGHRTTYLAPFRTIDQLSAGDRIVVGMPYGRFTYEVEKTRIVDPDDYWVTQPVGYERLVLTACHPLYSATERLAVIARRVKAERIDGTRAKSGGHHA